MCILRGVVLECWFQINTQFIKSIYVTFGSTSEFKNLVENLKEFLVLCWLRVIKSVALWEIGFKSSSARSIHITAREEKPFSQFNQCRWIYQLNCITVKWIIAGSHFESTSFKFSFSHKFPLYLVLNKFWTNTLKAADSNQKKWGWSWIQKIDDNNWDNEDNFFTEI